MFYEISYFNYDLSDWDVSSVTDMQWMFTYAHAFNQDLSKWDVSRVANMGAMFAGASAFNQDLSKWDVSRVTDMQWMFAYAESFQQTLCGMAWVNSVANQADMFSKSPGSISKTVCGVWEHSYFVHHWCFHISPSHVSTATPRTLSSPTDTCIPTHAH